MVTLIKAGQSQLGINITPGIIAEYYMYSLRLFQQILDQKNIKCNFAFGTLRDLGRFNDNPIRTICYQIEHTLVKKGGRGTNNALLGVLPDGVNDFYLVRLVNAQSLLKFDIIIEYSYQNMINLQTSGHFQEHLNRMLHIAPIIYYKKLDSPIDKDQRSLDVLTTFMNPGEPRRAKLIRNLTLNQINHKNYNNITESLQNILDDSGHDNRCNVKLYDTAKILLNIHQTDHHHTLEELRVLPALTTGILVISEDVPLKETIPYHEFIIWVPYDKVVETINLVLQNYNEYYQKYSISNQKLREILRGIHTQNLLNVESNINKVRDSGDINKLTSSG